MSKRTRVRRRHPAKIKRPQAGGVVLRLALVLVVLVIVSAAAVVLVVRLDSGGGGGQPTTGPSTPAPPPSGPGLTLHAPPPAPDVLSALTRTRPISVARLERHLGPELARPGLGRHVAFTTAQLGRPDVHWSYGAATTTPASTLKLLTTTAALSVLGPDHRFTTSVMRGSTRRTVVLVGGGDPLLAATAPTAGEAAGMYPQPASLEELAGATATGLLSQGVRQVRLAYDASRFSGPAVNPHWPSSYISDDVVSPISALWVNEGRETPGFAQRSSDPARAAAEAFSAELTSAGIHVVGDLAEQRAPRSGPPPVAEVTSAPLVQIVQHILEQSDNEGAEVLLRQVAVATGRAGSSVAGVAAVRATLTRLGLDVRGARFYDGSGLSRDDVVPTSLLLGVLETVAAASHPELRGVVTGLPVAGFSGSLGYRFKDKAAAGLGLVRAKTGTLTGVHGLAGIALTRSRQAMFFVAVADEVALPQTLEARADLDRAAAALTTCGC